MKRGEIRYEIGTTKLVFRQSIYLHRTVIVSVYVVDELFKKNPLQKSTYM